MATLKVQLVTPQRPVLQEEVDSLSCPTTEGQITVLPGHAELVATLRSGELIARQGNNEHNIHVAGGFVQVRPDNEIIILADAAEHFYEIDEQRAREAHARAQELLRKTNLSDEEYATAAASLERNLTRLNIVRKHAHRKARPVTSEGVFEE
jgi:F-type H+-transporting ATPase subunit epsilon